MSVPGLHWLASETIPQANAAPLLRPLPTTGRQLFCGG